MNRGTADWSAVIDANAADDSTAPIAPLKEGQTFSLEAFLPQRITQNAKTLLAECKAQWVEADPPSIFREQISLQETCQAQPRVAPQLSTNLPKALLASGQSGSKPAEPDAVGPVLVRQDVLKSLAALPPVPREQLVTGVIGLPTAISDALFTPIIVVPSAPSAPLQLCNIREFLEEACYAYPSYLLTDRNFWPVRESRPEWVNVSPRSFVDFDRYPRIKHRVFRVIDNVSVLTPETWGHVCAAVVTDVDWGFEKWFPDLPKRQTPEYLFSTIQGFLTFFEEDHRPRKAQRWNVVPIILTRRDSKSGIMTAQVKTFWDEIYSWLDTHPDFGSTKRLL